MNVYRALLIGSIVCGLTQSLYWLRLLVHSTIPKERTALLKVYTTFACSGRWLLLFYTILYPNGSSTAPDLEELRIFACMCVRTANEHIPKEQSRRFATQDSTRSCVGRHQ